MTAHHGRRTVVVGIDGSEHALRAARWGAAEAGRRNIALRLVHALDWLSDHPSETSDLGRRAREVESTRARGLLAAAQRAAQEARPDLEVEQQLIIGHPVEVLAAESRAAEIVVVGASGVGRIEGMLAGSVPVALVTHAGCPVVVVRGVEHTAADESTLPVVVGVDGSPISETAIAFAFDAASARGVPLVAVHTWAERFVDPAIKPLTEWTAGDEHALLAERLAGWNEKYPDVAVRRVLEEGRAARVLLGQSQRAQLVVVGTHGSGELTGLLLGSVGNTLVHKARCPVAVVHPGTPTTRRTA
ncbi:universal stress protein [Pseudonocardia sp. GCM10023141]|uniref:universal stress protein n=1 Tax=Pseudonocardia sp. GCM10023141 TaxID=3252653 RepID=UPI003620BE14